MAKAERILYETLGYEGTVSLKSINKPRLRKSLEGLEAIIEARKDAEKKTLQQSIMEKEIDRLKSEHQESLNYPYNQKKKEILKLVKKCYKHVDNTTEVSLLINMLKESETSKSIPKELEAKIESMKRLVAEQKKPDIPSIDIEIQNKIGQIFDYMCIERYVDNASKTPITPFPENGVLDSLKEQTTNYLSQHGAKITNRSRTILERIVNDINHLKIYSGREKKEAESNLIMYLTLLNGLNIEKETPSITPKKGLLSPNHSIRRELMFLQKTSEDIIKSHYGYIPVFVELYDKIPYNEEYISIVKNTAKQIRSCKIKKD